MVIKQIGKGFGLKRNILSGLFIAFVVFNIVGCTQYTPIYKIEKSKIDIKIDKDKYYKIPFDKENVKKDINSCVLSSIFVRQSDKKYNYSLDYIGLKDSCKWSAFSKTEYVRFIENSNNISNLTHMDKFENDKIDITKYSSDNGCSVYLIGIYGLEEDIFIVDKNGLMAKDILNELGSDTKVSIDKVCSEDVLELKQSIVKENSFYEYFKKEENKNLNGN